MEITLESLNNECLFWGIPKVQHIKDSLSFRFLRHGEQVFYEKRTFRSEKKKRIDNTLNALARIRSRIVAWLLKDGINYEYIYRAMLRSGLIEGPLLPELTLEKINEWLVEKKLNPVHINGDRLRWEVLRDDRRYRIEKKIDRNLPDLLEDIKARIIDMGL